MSAPSVLRVVGAVWRDGGAGVYGTVDDTLVWDLLLGETDPADADLSGATLATLIVMGMVLGNLPDGYRDGLAADVRQEIRSRGQGHQALAYSGALKRVQESISDEYRRIKQDLDVLEGDSRSPVA